MPNTGITFPIYSVCPLCCAYGYKISDCYPAISICSVYWCTCSLQITYWSFIIFLIWFEILHIKAPIARHLMDNECCLLALKLTWTTLVTLITFLQLEPFSKRCYYFLVYALLHFIIKIDNEVKKAISWIDKNRNVPLALLRNRTMLPPCV